MKREEAKDKVTINLDYERPPFSFPDLSSEQGNPIEYFKLAQNTLKSFGFYREAKELETLRWKNYEEHFNDISRFLDFSNSRTSSEDDEFIYIKIKKNSKNTEQPRVFGQKTEKEIKNLILENHDFSLVNCYGRNHLHYLDDLEPIKILVEANKKNNWFELFSLDNFNSTILHHRSLPVFSYLLNQMYEESPTLAKTFLYGTNVFAKNAFGEFLQQCDNIFCKKPNLPGEKTIFELCGVLKIIGKIDKQKQTEFIKLLDNIEEKTPIFKNANIKKTILKNILEQELNPKDKEITVKKIKI